MMRWSSSVSRVLSVCSIPGELAVDLGVARGELACGLLARG